jgi:hypothetical protein
MMEKEPIALANGILIPSAILLKPSLESSLWWAAIAFRAYLSLITLGIPDRQKPIILLFPKKPDEKPE